MLAACVRIRTSRSRALRAVVGVDLHVVLREIAGPDIRARRSTREVDAEHDLLAGDQVAVGSWLVLRMGCAAAEDVRWTDPDACPVGDERHARPPGGGEDATPVRI